MAATTILPDPESLHLICVYADPDRITLATCVKGRQARCPLCSQSSGRIHSRYIRVINDLPWQGMPVYLRLHARRFFCDNPECERRIFTERVPEVAASYGRCTHRLGEWLTHVPFALGGESEARLLRHLGVEVSGDSLLGCIRSFHLQHGLPPRVLSVDDFAFRKGRTYGTVLVDVERHKLVDLLPDRSARSFAKWLTQHPGVEVISRDRGGEYADGARQVAPGVLQVADRFHLIRNLADVTLRVLKRHSRLIDSTPVPGASHQRLTHLRLDREASRERTKVDMRERFESVHALASEGMNSSAIARALGLHRHTVQKYLALDAPPERRHYTRQTSIMAPYEGYVLERWKRGYRNAMALWREIVEMGYAGSYRNVFRLTGYLRSQERLGLPLPASPSGLTTRQVMTLALARDRTEEEQATVEGLKVLHPDIRQSLLLLEGFARLVRDGPREGAGEHLDRWMLDAESSGLREFRAFVVKLRQDLEAVLAGLSLPWSQGQAEGQINRLKTVKRSMYGRAKFDLLRQRILYIAA